MKKQTIYYIVMVSHILTDMSHAHKNGAPAGGVWKALAFGQNNFHLDE